MSYDSPDRDGDPIVAIDLLNRMDGLYSKSKIEVNVAPITSVTLDQAKAKLNAVVAEAHEAPG